MGTYGEQERFEEQMRSLILAMRTAHEKRGDVFTWPGNKAREDCDGPYISNVFTTSGGAGEYMSGSIEQLARPWLRLRIAEE